ncbi:MAG: excinuclease ABC subunit UvrC [Eubacteriales bacterium]|nr:excinuclease ABC subunit UvrC [Eubacteriales bacterium]
MFDIEEQLRTLPDKPGVYLMKDAGHVVIYVGKAVVLKNRVRSYFRSGNHSAKVRAMVENIASFEYIITDNELEALILECNLIKKYKPRYNILLRDDKTYPYIKVTVQEDFPRLMKVRRILNDKARYFGPYTNIAAVNQTLDILTGLYPIRTCNYDMARAIRTKMRPCLEYHIHNCIGPCTGSIDRATYMVHVDKILRFLSGHSDEVVGMLREKMRVAAAEQRYEEAADYRDKLQSVEDTLTAQKVTRAAQRDNTDALAVAVSGPVACVEVFFIRGGKMVGRENFIMEGVAGERTGDIIGTFMEQFYLSQKFIPDEILVEDEPPAMDETAHLLSERNERKVRIHVPQRGEKKRLIELVKKNAVEYLQKFVEPTRKRGQNRTDALEELQRILALDVLPQRIESYDISNIQGTDNIGAMVVYTDGKRDRHEYRRFKIKTVAGADDPASMAEIVERRLKYGNYPDLILLDGGRAQVNAVNAVLDRYGITIDVWGMFKDDRHRTHGLLDAECEFVLDRTSNLYRFVAGIQEEVHRYAISYFRSLHEKQGTRSVLDEIKGIGKVKRAALLKRFKSVEGIRAADPGEIAAIPGINERMAHEIQNYLEKNSRKGRDYATDNDRQAR